MKLAVHRSGLVACDSISSEPDPRAARQHRVKSPGLWSWKQLVPRRKGKARSSKGAGLWLLLVVLSPLDFRICAGCSVLAKMPLNLCLPSFPQV